MHRFVERGAVTARVPQYHRPSMGTPRRPIRSALRGSVRAILPVLLAATTATAGLVAAPVARVIPAPQVAAAADFSDGYFREFTAFSGLNKPVSIRFAADGRAFVAEKGGVLKAFDSVTDTTPTTVIDLRGEVNSYWDRGLLGIAIDPDFLTTRPYLYLYYVYDAPLGATAPVWNDACAAPPTGPGGTLDGCVVSSRLDRIRLDPSTNALVANSRTNLLWDWCQQFPSHSGGGMAFGPDEQLYLATGDGAAFTISDYGHRGGTSPDPVNPFTEVNPCGDPLTVTSPPDTTPSVNPATSEGGSLRSQDLRTMGDPLGLDGSLIRINPDTGLASAGNPLIANSDLNARRIVAHGFRNPFRLAFRPGTSEIYLGDVGNHTWEEIERVIVPTSARTPTTMPNFGWPCYEGAATSSWQTVVGAQLCTDLYAAGPTAVTSSLYAYSHVDTKSPTGPCFAPDATGKAGSAVTGVAFYGGPSESAVAYPSRYDGALFFVDYTRDCLAAIRAGAGGVPDPSQVEQIASGLANPVDLVTGPGGDLYYVDMDGGRVVRIRYLVAPNAKATATPKVSLAPVTVRLDGSTSTDPDPTSTLVAWRWDLDDDGAYDDATGQTYDWAISVPGVYPVSLEVENSNGFTDTVDLVVNAANAPPVPVIDTPSAALTWAVDDTISFTGHASDAEDGAIPAADLSWDVVMMHCPADCHEHVVQTFDGVASGSFPAPDHEYPSHLELRLTATDSAGATTRAAIELMPKTATISVDSVPAGVPIAVGADPVVSPSVTTVIRNGSVSISPPLVTNVGGTRHRFSTWNDSLVRVRDVVATGPISLTATYVRDAPDTCSTATTSSSTGAWLSDRASGNGDVDWFRFTLTSKRRVVITAGDLPVQARLDLYSSCSKRLTGADQSGTRYEELTRVLAAGTYRVKVSFPTGARADTPYAVRFRAMASGMPVKSTRITAGAGGGGPIRIVGEVLNNTGAKRGRATVTATFRDSAGRTVATLRGLGFARRLADGGVTPFVISGTVPAYASIRWSVTTSSLTAYRALSLGSLTRTTNQDGSVTERGTVKNTGTTTATSVMVARTWYDPRGEVLERGYAYVSPSTLGPGRTGTFTVLRPSLAGVQGTRTQVRAR